MFSLKNTAQNATVDKFVLETQMARFATNGDEPNMTETRFDLSRGPSVAKCGSFAFSPAVRSQFRFWRGCDATTGRLTVGAHYSHDSGISGTPDRNRNWLKSLAVTTPSLLKSNAVQVPQNSEFTPATLYSRAGVIFQISGVGITKPGGTERARFLGAVALEHDELESTEKDLVNYYDLLKTGQ